jgi:hypothetical protein
MYNKVSKSRSMTGPEKYYIMYGGGPRENHVLSQVIETLYHIMCTPHPDRDLNSQHQLW